MRTTLIAKTVAVLVASFSAGADAQTDDSWPRQLNDIRIETQPIFSSEQVGEKVLYRWINRFHRTTEPATIERALWNQKGDWLSREDVAEIERALRAIGVFADVEVRPSEQSAAPGDNSLDLRIKARDRVSLFPLVLPFSVGGVSGFGAVIVEENVLGRADRFVFTTAANDDDERRTRLEYTDRQLGDSFVRADFSAATTEEGDAFGVRLAKPFQHLRDPWRWSVSAGQTEERIDFFEDGDSITEIPQTVSRIGMELARGYGPITDRSALGVSLNFDDTEYGEAVGEQPELVPVPGDVKRTTLGVFHRWRTQTRFVVDSEIDRLGVDEDLPLGLSLDSFVGISERQQVGFSDQSEPLIGLRLRWATQPRPSTYFTVELASNTRLRDGSTRAYTREGALHAYQKLTERHTLAVAVDYDRALELDDLPPQLTLGEDNGLRGYPARQFTGLERLRVTIEDRMQLDWELLTFRFAGVAFFDAGWIGDDSLGSMRSSVGVGLRFGSPAITGGRILRLDVAVPLDEQTGEDFGPTVSFSIGHSFSFFGRRGSLSER